MLNQALATIRSVTFWGLDALNEGSVKSSYDEIKRMDSLASDDAEVKNHQASQFRKLVEHAVMTTQFYSQFDPEASLESFPIINKSKISKNKSAFLSDQYEQEKLVQMATSGSTGIPFISYQNPPKKRRVNAEVIYYSEKAGYAVGKNLIFLISQPDDERKSPFKQWIQNQSLVEIERLEDEDIEEMLQDVVKHSKSGSMLLAYGSTYDAFKEYLKKNGMDVLKEANITGVVSGAEMLYDDTRETIEEAFGCQMFSRYSNQENGVIGQDQEENNVFIINEASYIVEIADLETDELLPEGEVGRIVVTDLYNMAMPMIRYDTGDIGALTHIDDQGVKKKAIAHFAGRQLDLVYDCEGNMLSPAPIMMRIDPFPNIKQFQFVQEAEKEYTLKISSDTEFTHEAEIEQSYRKLVGEEAKITVELVDEIPVLSSGKRKSIVSKVNE